MPKVEHVERAAIQHAALTLALWPVLVLIRLYEVGLVRASHILPPGTGEAILRGIVHDLATSLWIGLALLPLGALGVFAPRSARAIHRAVLLLLAIIAVMFSQYFAITFVPLGADFWGY